MPHAVCSSRSAAELYAASAQALAEAAAEGLVLLRSSSSLSGYRGVLRDSQSTVGLKNPYRAQASLLAPLGRTWRALHTPHTHHHRRYGAAVAA